MPEYRQPGVYIEEAARGARAIEGVSTSTAALVGETARGPLRPVLVTSLAEFQRRYGGRPGVGGFLPDAVEAFFQNGGRRLVVARVAGRTAAPAQAACGSGFTLRAVGPGRWATRVFVRIEDSSAAQSPGGPPVGFRLRAAFYDAEPAGDPLDWFTGAAGAPLPACSEDFDNLVLDETSPDWWKRCLEGAALARLTRSATAPADSLPAKGMYRLAGGDDGAARLSESDYEGRPIAADDEPQGLAALALDAWRDVSLVYAPAASVATARAVIRHCEAVRFRFAIVDAPSGDSSARFDPRVDVAESKDAAFYFPWLRVADADGALRAVPPGGAVAGIYARTDLERGVHAAPANQVVRGAAGVTVAVGDLDSFNERHVNVIRELPGRGVRVRGARTLSSEPQWRYVNVRRLVHYVERSIEEGTRWAVFEPNDERLWTAVRDAVRGFLRACWRAGALQGAKEEHAFFVRCDRSTMTNDDVLNGRLVCEIGIAPVRPAEFVVLKIGWQSQAPRASGGA
jgi:phage tail sheath protein FI